MRKPTLKEIEQLPHITMTSDVPWEPQLLNDEPDDLTFFDALEEKSDEDVWVDCDEDYGEEFDDHELNVYSCLQAHASGTVRPPRSILPKKNLISSHYAHSLVGYQQTAFRRP